MKKTFWISIFLAATTLWGGSALAHSEAAHVEVQGAWVRATVPGQRGTGAFMRLKAYDESLDLVAVRSSVAGVSEVHEMKMEGDVMRMRAIQALPLPVGQTVELKPGGYHLMLQELKKQLVEGSEVPVTLEFKAPDGTLSRLHMMLPVAMASPEDGASSAAHGHNH